MDPSVLRQPQRYQGLYVFDFGAWSAVGYTAREVALLLEQERYRDGKVYRIERVAPDGSMELRGVSADRFQLETGMFFYDDDLDAARRDFAALRSAGAHAPPPCRVALQLADRGPVAARGRYVIAMILPAEHEQDIGRWLTEIGYAGGAWAEGGISHATNYQDEAKAVLDRAQLWGAESLASRSAEEVLASVREPVQRWAEAG